MSKKYNIGPDDEIHDEDYFRREKGVQITIGEPEEIPPPIFETNDPGQENKTLTELDIYVLIEKHVWYSILDGDLIGTEKAAKAIHDAMSPDQSQRISDMEDAVEHLRMAMDQHVGIAERLVETIDKLQSQRDQLLAFTKKVEQFHGPYILAGCKRGDLYAESKRLIFEIEGIQK